MKKIAIIAATLFLSIFSSAQDGKSLYLKYSDDVEEAACISPSMFRMLKALPQIVLGDDSIDITSTVQTLKGFYIMHTAKPEIRADIRKDLIKMVKNDSYEMMAEIKENGKNVRVFSVGDDEYISSLILTSNEGENMTVMSLDGKISREKLEGIIEKTL